MSHTYDIGLSYSNSWSKLGYILKTGATWANNIGHAKVTFDISDYEAFGIGAIQGDSFAKEMKDKYSVSLADLKYIDGKLIFEKWDFEPSHNLDFWITWKGEKKRIEIAGFDDVPKELNAKKSLAFFDAVESMTREQMIEAYNNLSYSNKVMETLYLNTKLGMPSVEYPPVTVSLNIEDRKYGTAGINDTNYNLMPYCEFTITDESCVVIKQGEMESHQYFGDYGIIEYYSNEFVQRTDYQYIITAYDYAGNTSITIFDSEGNILNQSVNGVEVDVNIPNPETSTSPTYLLWSFILLGVGLVLLVYKIKRTATVE
jgi:hypothetical protein